MLLHAPDTTVTVGGINAAPGVLYKLKAVSVKYFDLDPSKGKRTEGYNLIVTFAIESDDPVTTLELTKDGTPKEVSVDMIKNYDKAFFISTSASDKDTYYGNAVLNGFLKVIGIVKDDNGIFDSDDIIGKCCYSKLEQQMRDEKPILGFEEFLSVSIVEEQGKIKRK